MTLHRVVGEAVALLDAEGVDGLTMRRLAGHLGVTATALYWHVKTRGELLDSALDHVYAEVVLPPATADWRADVRTMLGSWRDTMLRHPWSPALAGRPLLGPNVLARIEFLQACLVRGGLAGFRLAAATRMLADFVVGSALTESSQRRADASGLRAQAGERLTADAARYPTLLASGHLDSDRYDQEALFVRVLDGMLGGLADDLLA